MASKQIKTLVGRVVEAWNTGEVSAIDEVFAPSYVLHPLWPNVVPFGPQSLSDREQIKHAIHGFRGEFPDLQAGREILEAENKVITRWTFQGTTKAGKPVSWTSIIISRVAGKGGGRLDPLGSIGLLAAAGDRPGNPGPHGEVWRLGLILSGRGQSL